MAKERISSAELAQRKEEYYELLALCDSSLRDVLNQRGGLILARVGRYQPWPARYSEPGEFAKMARYRAKKGQACVYFFGSRNYGWVSKSSIQPFPEDLTTLTASTKYNQLHIQEALDEAKIVIDMTDETGKRFYDRIMERKDEAVDLPCERCNRVDDHYSLLILCDGKDCKREYHMNCLSPPLVSVPPGEWFCPDCEREREKELERELLKRTKTELMGIQDPNSAIMNGMDGMLPLAKISSLKKTKKYKYKHNSRDGIAKRRLSTVSPDTSVGLTKKPRGRRSSSREVSPSSKKDELLLKRLDGRRKKATQLSVSSNRSQLFSDPDSGTAGDEVRSEEKCLICGFGGELIVCEFIGCTKVYHQFCLGSYPFPKDEDAIWFCPRHTCALTGGKETCEDAEKSSSKLKHASPRKTITRKLLWKCNECPLAISDEAMPQLPHGQIFSKRARIFLCPHCYLNAPFKVQLAKKLEKIWSTLATNRQGLPFCGPLLCGVESVDGQFKEHLMQMDLFKILAKIRRLEYEEFSAFSLDIDLVVANALEFIANRSLPLMEAARTLKIICNEQFAIYKQKLYFLENKLRRAQTAHTDRQDDEGVSAAQWPLRWRQECGPFEDRYYAQLDSKSLEEWTAFVTAAPLYAKGNEFDNRIVAGTHSYDELSGNEATSQRPLACMQIRRPSLGTADMLPSFPAAIRPEAALSLSDKTDVMLALGDLARLGSGIQKRKLGCEQAQQLDNLDAREFFLSPSTSEMQHMFNQQSTVLRNALEAHSTLQRSWLISQQDMLELGGSGGFSVGEGRLAAELRLANKNLRQRLRNKDKLVDQLTSDHMALRSEVISLQKELSQSKTHARELEDRIAVVQGANESQIGSNQEYLDSKSIAGAKAMPDRSADEEHFF
ncbi:phd zinc finger (c3hc4 type) family protein [Plasmopara halstedii]|uniref:Phd zinc finger (C3hc4 type) family protein n=1 Tax=Plasmopara halstedii TaxID=4781 RepID=A0A0P1B3T2_PLAHL|nr:phd zinc finger (c3hc4 type) family protein [Plasmopara halstedii]CEG48552.1 phd zinc finger (c3hc4 type) family protein [Plasmopara halstedii]|eukprot:XP_024584921.1 phd zinc finger (c3hc4 type) family protein [Plasmopara halstedii]